MATVAHTVTLNGKEYFIEYFDSATFPSDLVVRQVYGVCFNGDGQVILGLAFDGNWGILGGHVEEGETLMETLHREIIEESNHKVVDCHPIGYQRITTHSESYYQVRYACLVEKLGEFVQDGDGKGSIVEVKAYDVDQVPRYWDWGQSSKFLLQRAVEIHSQHWRAPSDRD